MLADTIFNIELEKIHQPWRFAVRLFGMYPPRCQIFSACACRCCCKEAENKGGDRTNSLMGARRHHSKPRALLCFRWRRDTSALLPWVFKKQRVGRISRRRNLPFWLNAGIGGLRCAYPPYVLLHRGNDCLNAFSRVAQRAERPLPDYLTRLERARR